ncbi:MAG TPA: biotin--[acetyl-CoA-carboxylase] ligase, partial [Opitutus sp.]|nr:biotin--[acetyl-CoA-carboxylase] ligase [Opitutus sp.]
FNRPELKDTSLGSTTTRLADLIPAVCGIEALTPIILRAIRRVHALMCQGDFPLIARELNAHWSNPRLVSILLNDHAHPFTGLFTGIDESGRLQVTTDYAHTCSYEASRVTLLRELE